MARPHTQFGKLKLRAPRTAMALPRMGCHYPTRLSFMRVLTRKMLQERWKIDKVRCKLDQNGVGDLIYTVTTPSDDVYTFVVFTHELPPEQRSDRVIAERWDLTATFCSGLVDDTHLEQLRQNVPKQEKGRLDNRSMVLTRANKSSRNFDYVVDCLADGRQPSTEAIAKVGYLYRTTAVYGSGKFGQCDWHSLKKHHPDFGRPFAAEMMACFLLRQASFDVVEHVAKEKAPDKAVSLCPNVKRYMGIGNATGLGMAPFLICHPLLINRWMECRELALARVRAQGTVNNHYRLKLSRQLQRAQQHLGEIVTANEGQNDLNRLASAELGPLIDSALKVEGDSWEPLLEQAESTSMDTQEILNSCLIEIYPDLVDELAESMSTDESFDIRPEQSLAALKVSIETRYRWALDIDFDDPDSHRMFWYRSAEKLEPRLGEANVDIGADRQMHVDIAQQINDLYEYVCDHLDRNPHDRVAHFLINLPMLRYIVRRVQTMSRTSYGEIQANLLDADIAPTDLMRCKLSFFGVSKFDPQSRLWVRNTMFQGAPIIEDIVGPANDSTSRPESMSDRPDGWPDNWSFPIKPSL